MSDLKHFRENIGKVVEFSYHDGPYDERNDGDDDDLPSAHHIRDDATNKAAEDGRECPARGLNVIVIFKYLQMNLHSYKTMRSLQKIS